MAAKTEKFKILSLDGGGIRGLITAKWLEALEAELGGPAGEHFDLIAGTSTGSVLASAISCGIPASKIASLYMERGRKIFPSTSARLWNRAFRTFSQGGSAPKYDDKGLAEELQREFKDGRKHRLFDKLPVKTVITSYDIFNRCPVIFRSWEKKYKGLKLWEVVKASCSAPTYFPAHVMKVGGAEVPLIDGGVVANNPASVALTTARGILKTPTLDTSKIFLASFGTGSCTRPYKIEEGKCWGPLEWAIPIIDVLFDGSADATDYLCAEVVPSDQYFRFQVGLHEAYDDMDNASQTNLNALVSTAMNYLNGPPRGSRQIKKLAKALLA